MICDEDILQFFFDNLNQSMSPLKISYCHISSGPIGYPKTLEWNYHLMLRTIQEESTSQNMFNFNVSFCQENAKWLNINVFCDITSENA
jgi:hypothetical protein